MFSITKRLIFLLLILLSVSSWAGGGSPGYNGTFQVYLIEFPEFASAALERINEFRLGAEEYLAREDLSPAAREALSVLVLQPPLEEDERLSAAAEAHARDMLERGYLSHVSPEGFGPMERVLSTGYPAAFVGESAMILLFEQPLSPEQALEVLLRQLEEDALAMRSAEAAPLIFPFYRHAGAAMAAGVLMFEGHLYYAYVLDLMLALSEDYLLAAENLLLGRVEPFENGQARLKALPKGPDFRSYIFPDGSFFFHQIPPGAYILSVGGRQVSVFMQPGKSMILDFSAF